MSLFFFLCYVDHQHLHSFPTRRSSDLTIDRKVGLRLVRNHSASGTEKPIFRRAMIASGTKGATDCLKIYFPVRDRKSTRLNSSHLGISYAVFCLKKKKEPLERMQCERG